MKVLILEMTKGQTIGDAIDLAKKTPYTGTSEDIVILSCSIAETFKNNDISSYNLYKENVGIAPKIFSKLKVIGEKILSINESKRRDLIERLPASYSCIHVLCALKAEELITAAKSKVLSPSMSVREARAYVQQIKFPTKAALDGEKGKWGYKQERLFNICRPDNVLIEGEVMTSLEKELRKVCSQYGLSLQQANTTSNTTLREQERTEKGMFWKTMLAKELTQKWFDKSSPEVRKQFNIRNLQELHEAPIRSFTGFIIKTDGSKDKFWKDHGNAYIAKMHMLSELDDDAAQRYNYRRRLEEVMGKNRDLAIWRNLILKDSGFI